MRLLFVALLLFVLASPALANPYNRGHSRYGYHHRYQSHYYGHRYYGYKRWSYRAHGHHPYHFYRHMRWRPYGFRYGVGNGLWRGTRSFGPYAYGAGFRGGFGDFGRFGGGYGGGYAPYAGYYVRPYAALAPIYSRYGASLTLADEVIEREPGGDQPVADGDGLPQPRAKPVGAQFITTLKD
ncbi:MAG: hypothetical protein ACYTGN_02625 [Planctomycetota bacterium]|jgi:hypothetical protein